MNAENVFTFPSPKIISASIILRWMMPPTIPILTSQVLRFRSICSLSYFYISSCFDPWCHEHCSQSHPAVLFLSTLPLALITCKPVPSCLVSFIVYLRRGIPVGQGGVFTPVRSRGLPVRGGPVWATGVSPFQG
ncbi:hypothetical protein DL93DRAFT_542851 [Clavulina sp. PMI_390]|nr:hypothetical protein DL93DRAFT_542851 [Clavulina sp. PMI_390]